MCAFATSSKARLRNRPGVMVRVRRVRTVRTVRFVSEPPKTSFGSSSVPPRDGVEGSHNSAAQRCRARPSRRDLAQRIAFPPAARKRHVGATAPEGIRPQPRRAVPAPVGDAPEVREHVSRGGGGHRAHRRRPSPSRRRVLRTTKGSSGAGRPGVRRARRASSQSRARSRANLATSSRSGLNVTDFRCVAPSGDSGAVLVSRTFAFVECKRARRRVA